MTGSDPVLDAGAVISRLLTLGQISFEEAQYLTTAVRIARRSESFDRLPPKCMRGTFDPGRRAKFPNGARA